MSLTHTNSTHVSPTSGGLEVGALGRLGYWMATHFRIVAAAWVVLAMGLGVFAPRVEKALSGAGWEATGSESVQARQLIDRSFNGLGSYALTVVVQAREKTVSDPAFRRVLKRVEAKLEGDPAVAPLRAEISATSRSKQTVRPSNGGSCESSSSWVSRTGGAASSRTNASRSAG